MYGTHMYNIQWLSGHIKIEKYTRWFYVCMCAYVCIYEHLYIGISLFR